MTGVIFNIQRFSLHDGPGIRTTVFLKGCPLDCIWCHNPESKKVKPQLAFSQVRCVGCGQCAAVCPNGVHTQGENERVIHFENCVACGKCVEVCTTAALEIMGRTATAEEVIREVESDLPFYENSGGGMTLSGGEPAMQPEFAAELLRLAREKGIHTAIETAGYIDWKVYEKLLPFLDMVLFDCKQMNSGKHRQFTGRPNELIHNNLRKLCEKQRQVEVIVRTPVIPGYNDELENFHALADFLHTLERLPKVEVLPYNPLAGSKHPRIGTTYELDVTEADGTVPDVLCQILKDAGITAKVVR